MAEQLQVDNSVLNKFDKFDKMPSPLQMRVEWTADRLFFTFPQHTSKAALRVVADEADIAALNDGLYAAVLTTALRAVGDNLGPVLDMGGCDGCGASGVLAIHAGAAFVYTISGGDDNETLLEQRLLPMAKQQREAQGFACDTQCGKLEACPLELEWSVIIVHPVATCGLLRQDLLESCETAVNLGRRTGHREAMLLPGSLKVMAALVQWDGVQKYNQVDDHCTCVTLHYVAVRCAVWGRPPAHPHAHTHRCPHAHMYICPNPHQHAHPAARKSHKATQRNASNVMQCDATCTVHGEQAGGRACMCGHPLARRCGFAVAAEMAQFSVGTFLEVDAWAQSVQWLSNSESLSVDPNAQCVFCVCPGDVHMHMCMCMHVRIHTCMRASRRAWPHTCMHGWLSVVRSAFC